MAQQTAMQKLLTNLESIGITIPQGVEMIYLRLEKEQIMDSYLDGRVHQESGKDSEWYNLTCEDYYSKMFKDGKSI